MPAGGLLFAGSVAFCFASDGFLFCQQVLFCLPAAWFPLCCSLMGGVAGVCLQVSCFVSCSLTAALLAVCLPLGSGAVCNYLESCQLCRLQRPKVNIIGAITKLISFSVAAVGGASLAGPLIHEGIGAHCLPLYNSTPASLSATAPRPATASRWLFAVAPQPATTSPRRPGRSAALPQRRSAASSRWLSAAAPRLVCSFAAAPPPATNLIRRRKVLRFG